MDASLVLSPSPLGVNIGDAFDAKDNRSKTMAVLRESERNIEELSNLHNDFMRDSSPLRGKLDEDHVEKPKKLEKNASASSDALEGIRASYESNLDPF